MKKILIPNNYEGQRFDVALTDLLNKEVGINRTRSFIKKYIPNGVYKVDGSNVKPSCIVQAGEEYLFDETLLEDASKRSFSEIDIEGQDAQITAQYEDFLFAIKNRGDDVLKTAAILAKTGLIDKEMPRNGIVHRLDKPVGGIMVFAKNTKGQNELSRLFLERGIQKYYIANVKELAGKFEKGYVYRVYGGIIRDRKKRIRRSFKLEGIDKMEPGKIFKYKDDFYTPRGYRKAILELRIIGKNRLLIKLLTGRNHQIRATLKALGMIIVGDTLYGKEYLVPKAIDLWSIHIGFEYDNKVFSAGFYDTIGLEEFESSKW